MRITAETRTVIKPNHALITPDGYVNSGLPGWQNCIVNILISPQMGARFTQQLIILNPASEITVHTDAWEWFFFVLGGSCRMEVEGIQYLLSKNSFLFIPPTRSFSIQESSESCQLVSFQKEYRPLKGVGSPELIQGNLADLDPEMYMEDPQLHMQYLLPDQPSFDMAINVFSYQPGGNLPFVETHIMEHGLIYLAGQGIYRLDEFWYPVQKGDVIWMAPYCPQWFVAMGKEPAVYLYYKDVNRDSLQK